jgi:hypothetical protein
MGSEMEEANEVKFSKARTGLLDKNKDVRKKPQGHRQKDEMSVSEIVKWMVLKWSKTE